MSAEAEVLGRQPAPRAVAGLALGFLEEAVAARRRARAGGDAEALHDERVALRRLRSTLRAYRAIIGKRVPRRLERRIAALAGASNAARDAQVQLLWLDAVAEAGGGAAERLRARLADAASTAAAPVAGFGGLRRHLRKRLKRLARCKGAPFAAVAADRIEAERGEVLARLGAIGSAGDEAPAHRTRIAVKRLRYLLTPFAAPGNACAEAVAQLKRLQDLLGELHDRHLFCAQAAPLLETLAGERAARLSLPLLAGETVEAAAWEPPEAAQLAALAARSRADATALFTRLEEAFLARPEALGERLAAAVAEVRESGGAGGG